MRDRETEEEMSGGSFMDDPRLHDMYLSLTPRERRSMAEYFHRMNILTGGKMSAKEKKKLYDDYFELEQNMEGFMGCLIFIVGIPLLVLFIYLFVKG